MRFYEVKDGISRTITCDTFDAAKKEAQSKRDHIDYRDITVDEIEVPLDKANVLRLLNDEGGTHQYLRQWGMTPRGGLTLQERED